MEFKERKENTEEEKKTWKEINFESSFYGRIAVVADELCGHSVSAVLLHIISDEDAKRPFPPTQKRAYPSHIFFVWLWDVYGKPWMINEVWKRKEEEEEKKNSASHTVWREQDRMEIRWETT